MDNFEKLKEIGWWLQNGSKAIYYMVVIWICISLLWSCYG